MNKQKVDEGLYSRQLLEFGKDAMNKMIKSNVLISGMSGLGIEVAKCVILGGAKSVTLHDNDNYIDASDFSSSYYLKFSDLHSTKLDKIDAEFKSLNPNVNVTTTNEPITEDNIKNYDVVVFCDYNLYDLFRYNELCRKYKVKFIMSNSHGLYGYLFCDFGEEFIVTDADGERVKSGILVNVCEKDYNGKNIQDVIVSNERHGLERGDMINIRCDGKLLGKVFKVETVVDLNNFVLDENPFRSAILSKTEFEQVKVQQTVNFMSLEQSVNKPEFAITNFKDFERPMVLHAFTRAMWQMYTVRTHNTRDKHPNRFEMFPRPWSEEDAQTLFGFCTSMTTNVNEDVIRKLSYTSSGKLCPNDSVIGSIAAQEVMKACSGKYTPIKQWMYIDHLEAFPKVELPFTGDVSNFTPDGSRYDGQIVVFGKEVQDKIKHGKIFVVGSGAIGCDHLKNLCMMGVGQVVVTDMDHIEKSNLSRQFLFRTSDIGKSKSVTAAEKVKSMNPCVVVEAHENKVCNESLNTYNETFFKSLTCVANALDNVEARKFVDMLCVYYNKFLIDPGTLGTKGHVQVIIPGKSESYGSANDFGGEESIPVCTLKVFPYLFEHVVQYVRDIFEGYFTTGPNNYINVVNNFDDVKSKDRTDILNIYKNVKKLKSIGLNKYTHCVKLAYSIWHKKFRDKMYKLTKQFPKDCTNKDGTPFWSGSKRFPDYFEFDAKNADHLGFVMHMAHLWADLVGIKERVGTSNRKKHIKLISKFEVPELKDDGKKIKIKEKNKEGDNEEQEPGDPDETQDLSKKELLKELKKLTKNPITFYPLVFEKDDDTNHHIDFITHAANMRALNYSIETKDRLQVKQIAGKIIPAIATTTSLVSGLASMELYKIFQGKTDLEDYNNSYCNLAIAQYSQSEPTPVHTSIINEKSYNIWESHNVNGDITLGELVKMFEESVLTHNKLGKLQLELGYVGYSDKVLYQGFMEYTDKELNKPMRNIIRKYTKDSKVVEEVIVSLELSDDMAGTDQCNLPAGIKTQLLANLAIEPISIKVVM